MRFVLRNCFGFDIYVCKKSQIQLTRNTKKEKRVLLLLLCFLSFYYALFLFKDDCTSVRQVAEETESAVERALGFVGIGLVHPFKAAEFFIVGREGNAVGSLLLNRNKIVGKGFFGMEIERKDVIRFCIKYNLVALIYPLAFRLLFQNPAAF